MEKQSYKNHIRYYPPHHFVFIPLMIILTIVGIWKAYTDEPNRVAFILFSILSFCILYLATMLRQHYALSNQNRIVRLEFRLRYFERFGRSSDEVEKTLSFSQIAALRFADNIEFPALLDRALKDNLSGDEIKKAINNWQADHMRV
jgi:hypothetical protein